MVGAQAGGRVAAWYSGLHDDGRSVAVATFDGALDAMVLADDAGTYVDANPAAYVLSRMNPRRATLIIAGTMVGLAGAQRLGARGAGARP